MVTGQIGTLFRAIDAQISVHRQMFEEAAAGVRVKVGERLIDGSLLPTRAGFR